MKVSLIAAIDRNRVIGTGRGIPWNLPRDKRHFRHFTAGKHMLVGRRTYEEMRGWFTSQTPVVLTRDPDYPAEHIAHSVADAIAIAEARGAEELVVSGGASVYEVALPFAEELILTLIDAAFEGDAVFPDYESTGDWREVSRVSFPADKENPHAFAIIRLVREIGNDSRVRETGCRRQSAASKALPSSSSPGGKSRGRGTAVPSENLEGNAPSFP